MNVINILIILGAYLTGTALAAPDPLNWVAPFRGHVRSFLGKKGLLGKTAQPDFSIETIKAHLQTIRTDPAITDKKTYKPINKGCHSDFLKNGRIPISFRIAAGAVPFDKKYNYDPLPPHPLPTDPYGMSSSFWDLKELEFVYHLGVNGTCGKITVYKMKVPGLLWGNSYVWEKPVYEADVEALPVDEKKVTRDLLSASDYIGNTVMLGDFDKAVRLSPDQAWNIAKTNAICYSGMRACATEFSVVRLDIASFESGQHPDAHTIRSGRYKFEGFVIPNNLYKVSHRTSVELDAIDGKVLKAKA